MLCSRRDSRELTVMRAGGLQKWGISGGELVPLTTPMISRSFGSYFMCHRQSEALQWMSLGSSTVSHYFLL